ncbi:protein phosphatase 2C domain-containing protein [Vreelandella sp. EE22]
MRGRCIAALSARGQPGYNEDACWAGSDLAFVLDGATGLGAPLLDPARTGYATDAEWFVNQLSHQLVKAWRRYGEVQNALDAALDDVARQWRQRVPQRVALERLPSASLALVAMEQEVLVLARLGDCELYTAGKNGIERAFEEGVLHRLDKKALGALRDYQAKGVPFLAARDAVAPLLAQHRRRINRSDGYPALSVALDSVKAEIKRLPAGEIRRVLLASDGFSAAWQQYQAVGPAGWLESSLPADALDVRLKGLREFEENDPACQKATRFKQHDDATALIYERVEENES